MAFNPLVKKIEKARFVAVNFTPERMAEIALPVTKSVQDRIYEGMNAYDQPAKPLAPRYLKQKQRKGRKAVRDLALTGSLMRAMHVLSTNNGQAVIGFTDPLANKKMYYNNARELQFAMSPRNNAEFLRQVNAKPIVTTKRGE